MYLIDSVATGRAGHNLEPQRWWPKETTKNKRRMISEQIHHFEESKRLAIAVAQPKQGAWTRWENTKIRTITWSDIKEMEPKQLPVNLKLWQSSTSNLCKSCGEIANLKHLTRKRH